MRDLLEMLRAWQVLDHAREHPETPLERRIRFTPGNNAAYGEDNWVECTICPPDALGHPQFHSKAHHGG